MSPDIFLYLYAFLFIAFMAIILGVFLSIRANKQKILKSLNFTLYEVAIPQTNSQQKPGTFKEHVSIIKQFYSGMVALNSYFVLK